MSGRCLLSWHTRVHPVAFTLWFCLVGTAALAAAPAPTVQPTHGDVSYGPHPHQALDVYLPLKGKGPFPIVIHFATLWAPSKPTPALHWYHEAQIGFVMVEVRTMTDAVKNKVQTPVSYCLLDARRAVQFVRLHAAEWNLDPKRIALVGSSQGALPALFVGCSGEKADPLAADPVERVSTKVNAVVAFGSQPSIDPKRMQEWVPGVRWGQPALGCTFEESLKRHDELLPAIKQWSPDHLLNRQSAPIFFSNHYGLTKPDNVELMPYLVHSPKWALGFQQLAQQHGVPCYVDFPGHPAEKYKTVWEFLATHLAAGSPPKQTASDRATVRLADKQDVIVFQEAGRYGGWPANSGVWSWGKEIVVGFTAGWYLNKPGHAVDPGKPQEKWQARSVDGGLTWSIEKHDCFVSGKIKPSTLDQPLDFTHPDFAMMFAFWNGNEGPSWIFVSTDRCRTWRGPFAFAVQGIDKVVTRTDYLVLGKRECLMFGSGAKQNGRQGRAFCARTTDGGLTWRLVSLIGPEPAGYTIMPSTLRLAGDAMLTMIRHAEPGRTAWIDAYRSDDAGRQWNLLGEATSNIGNPPSLVRLNDGRICLTYGYRLEPFGARARITRDEGRSWGPEIILRDDGLTDDLGYARSVVRPDGKIVTIYYFNGPKHSDRTIQATIWRP